MIEKLKKRLKWSALAGAVLGVGCYLAPAEYQDACHAIAKVLPAVCGL